MNTRTTTIRLNEEELIIFKSLAKLYNCGISTVIKKCALEHAEDIYDLSLYQKAEKEYKKNPKTYTSKEVMEALGIEEI